MKVRISQCIFAAFFVLFLSLIARAEIMVGTSVEWMTSASKIVAVGKLEKISETKWLGSVIYESYVLKTTEVIKGDKRQKEIKFINRSLSAHNSLKGLAENGNQVIVFLTFYGETDNEKFLHGKLVPTNKIYPLSVVNLDNPGKYIIDTNFIVLRNKESIVEICRKSVKDLKKFSKENPSVKIESRVVEVPMGSEAFNSLYAGSVVYLTVPNFMFLTAKKSIFAIYKSQ